MDAGVLIALILLIFVIGACIYYAASAVKKYSDTQTNKQANINATINKQEGYEKNYNKSINQNTNTANINSTNALRNYNTNFFLNTNTNSNINKATNTALNTSAINNNNEAINTKISNLYNWQKLSIGSAIADENFDLQISLKETDGSTQKATLELNYSGRDTYNGLATDPGATGWHPNPSSYPELSESSSLLDNAITAYRTHYYCNGELDTTQYPLGRETIDLTTGYSNFVCRSREYEQCTLDGSFDKYYDERCDYGEVVFSEGQVKCSSNFAVAVTSITTSSATIGIAPLERGQSCSSLNIFE